MSEKSRAAIEGNQLVDAVVKHVSNEDYRMKPGDRTVVVNSSTKAVTITLPDMAQAAGKFYFIAATTGNTQDVSVVTGETQTEISTYGDMDAADDHALFYCTGERWLTIFDGVA